MIEPGQTLQQRYRIDRQIGQGGMGAVYVATDQRFGSTVAIKETLCMDDNFRKAIEREARLLNSLKHAALPRVSDHFEEENSQFLVMEYIAGEDVGSMLDPDNHRFPVDEVLKWADQLLDALDYLHNQGLPVIHRDIKPQNLKINPKGDMILLDFGLAKGNPTDAGHNTAAKSIFGYSRNYASLEQIQGTGTDPRSDLYSLAATLYHLLTNSPPADALTRAMAVLSNRPDPLTPANSIEPSVPRGLAGVLHNAMALNAEERPASAAEMRQMLRDHEKYAYLLDHVAATRNGNTGVFGHATKIMPAATAAAAAQTEAKTEVLPASADEDLTSIRAGMPAGASTSVQPANLTAVPKKKGGKAIAAAGGLLILVGGAVGGLYLKDPSLFRPASTSQTEPPAFKAEVSEAPPPAPAPNQPATEIPVSAGVSQPANAGTSATTHPNSGKTQQETAKVNKGQNADGNSDDEDVDVGEIDVPHVEVHDVPGGIDIVKTIKGKTTITHVATGARVMPDMPDLEKSLRSIDQSKLTAEQRRKLQQAVRMSRRKPPETSSPRPPEQPDEQ